MQKNTLYTSLIGSDNESNTFKLDLSSLISALDDKLEDNFIEATIQDDTIGETTQEYCEVIATDSINSISTDTSIEYVSLNLEENLDNGLISEELKKSDEIWNEDILKISEAITLQTIVSSDTIIDSNFDDSFGKELLRLNKNRKHKKIANFFIDKSKFLAHYIVVSTVVFFILLGGVNYNAYSKITYNFINPNSLKNSSKEIMSAIDGSKIKVFADEDTSLLGEEQQDTIQRNLAEDNTQLRDTYFSPKKLVPLRSNVNMDVEVMPYENRIMIPKIGKNIPLVDVDERRGVLDFANLENIFMKELEKGVLRYPGTAKPGEKGNTFVFGHSSNYVWETGAYNDVFALLDNLENGDEIIVYYNQKKFVYVVNEKKVIKPGNIGILERDPNKKELSLMTCWPVGTSINRLITFAELKETTNQ